MIPLETNLEWGLNMTWMGMGMVFVMLAILMLCLMAMPLIDKILPAESEEEEETAAAPAPVAAPAAPAGGLSNTDLAAIAIALHTAQGQADTPALVANQSGTGLTDSRWVSVGRSTNSQPWHRS